jgi:hypothetical protein
VIRCHLAFGTPRKLPKASALVGRVAVLDIAFAADGTGHSFEKVTEPFLQGLGERLAIWVDHHDHNYHERFRGNPKFVLATKAEHGALPEMVTPELVARVGAVDTIVCHIDLDGLYSAARWMLGGKDPYPGAEDDARAVDTRMGVVSARGAELDRALRANGRDEDFLRRVVSLLLGDDPQGTIADEVREASRAYERVEATTRTLATERYVVHGDVAWCDVSDVSTKDFDKTDLLLLGQQQARVSMVLDTQNVILAAAFDSGINFLTLLGVGGGMPTRVSVPRAREGHVRRALRAAGLLRDG